MDTRIEDRPLEVLLLGPLEVRLDGKPVALPGGRARALLAVLALGAGHAVAVDHLIDLLWGPVPPPTATTALQGLVSGLRKRLEPGERMPTGASSARRAPPQLLLTRHPGYLLAVAPEQVDAHRFRSLVRSATVAAAESRSDLLHEALSLWRGDPLEDVELVGGRLAEAAALEELRLGALEERIDADLAQGRHGALAPEIQALVTEHPYRERLRAQLMLVHYRCGRQRAALEVWHDTRATLVEQVGVEPGPGLRTLHRAVLEHDPALDLAGGSSWKDDTSDHAREQTARAGELLAAAGARVFERHYDAETAAELFAGAELLLPRNHPQHDEVADRVPETYLMLGRHGDADAWLSRALVLNRARGDARREVHLQLERARIQLIRGPDPIPLVELEVVADEALARAGADGDDDLMSQACYVLGLIALRRGDPVRMEELARRAVAAADRSRSPRERLASRWWLALALAEGPTAPERSVVDCEQLVDMGDGPHLGVLTELARLHAVRGALPDAEACMARAEDQVARRPGMLRPAMFVALRRAQVDLLTGHPERSVPHLRRALAAADGLGELEPRTEAAARLARVLAGRGHGPEAAELAHLSCRTAPRESVTSQVLWRVAMAAVRSADGDGEAAERLHDEAVGLVPEEMTLLARDVRLPYVLREREDHPAPATAHGSQQGQR